MKIILRMICQIRGEKKKGAHSDGRPCTMRLLRLSVYL